MDFSLLMSSLIFASVSLVGFLIFYYSDISQKRKEIRDRIKKAASSFEMRTASGGGKLKESLGGILGKFGAVAGTGKEEDVSRTRRKLLQAGYSGENDAKKFVGSKLFAALLFFALFIIVRSTVLCPLPGRGVLMFSIFSIAAGFYFPDIYILQKKQKRQQKIFQGFPDALDLIVVCVEAGMGLDAAIKRVGDELELKNKVLSEEFRILSLELKAGKPRADALRNLAMRTDLEDISSLVTLLIQTDKFGTRVAQALRVHSDAMRTKRYQRAEEIAAKLPVKIVFPLILFIFPSLFVPIIGPAAIKIYRSLNMH